MKKSLVKWLRRLVLLGIASASLLQVNNLNAHDLPIFDSLTPLNCFGIGSCGFPIESRDTVFSARATLTSTADSAGYKPQFDWTLADCFAGSCKDPLGQASLPELNQTSTVSVQDVANADENWSDELIGSAQQTSAFNSNLSYPVSSLSLFQAIGIQIPKFDLNETLKQIPKTILDLYHNNADKSDSISNSASQEKSHLGTRPLVDDYLGQESFVRDWRSNQSYRGLNRLDYLQHDGNQQESEAELLAVAVPKSMPLDISSWLATIVTNVSEYQCSVSQEFQDFLLTSRYSQLAGQSLASFDLDSLAAVHSRLSDFSHWTTQKQFSSIEPNIARVDDLFGQPAFLIYQVEGKEFLLPAKQARHWNCVPSFPTRSALSAQGTLRLQDQARSPDQNSPGLVVNQSHIIGELANSLSNGLQLVASQLQRFAGQLRSVAGESSQIATRSEDEGIR